MGQALYRKYRPKGLGEVVGQEHIARTLEAAIKSGRISHAYLFTGPRGTGKTSVARILAHGINGLPYDDDSAHLDIIEIDAASNRRIDEIRGLRDRVNIAPTAAKYKVYIIDEVHMLTREAFNALLKTLEEPPAHVVFILATTEAHKLPETIISRTQRFTFKPVPIADVAGHLRTIAKQENIAITDDALELIARHGEGSFRDSISLLDQAGGQTGSVDADTIQTMLGIPPIEATESLLENLASHDGAGVVQLLAQLREQGFGSAQIAKQLGETLRVKILRQAAAEDGDFELLQKLLNVPGAHDPARYLEIILLEYALGGQRQASSVRSQESQDLAIAQPRAIVAAKVENNHSLGDQAAEQITVKSENPAPKKPDETQTPEAIAAPVDDNLWPLVLAEIKKKHNTLYGVVRMAQANFTRDSLELGFAFAFHRKRVAEAKNQAIIAGIVKKISGQTMTINCIEAAAKPEITPVTAVASPDITSISNIFGGGELLES